MSKNGTVREQGRTKVHGDVGAHEGARGLPWKALIEGKIAQPWKSVAREAAIYMSLYQEPWDVIEWFGGGLL